MKNNLETFQIDPELKELLPPPTETEYNQLEQNILKNGFDNNFPIMIWNGVIADGHNRYEICHKHNIPFVYGRLGYETKEQVKKWMLDIQLGRRNLSPMQRIAIAEKYRELYEKQAKEKQIEAGGDKKSDGYQKSLTPDLGEAIGNRHSNETNTKLAKVANVGKETYRQAKKILDSGDEELKKAVMSQEMSIHAGYKKLKEKDKKPESAPVQTEPAECTALVPVAAKQQTKEVIDDEVRRICEDLKTEKTKEYLDSIWDYRISIIESMNVGFKKYYSSFASILHDMDGRVRAEEFEECIANAEEKVEMLLEVIEAAKQETSLRED